VSRNTLPRRFPLIFRFIQSISRIFYPHQYFSGNHFSISSIPVDVTLLRHFWRVHRTIIINSCRLMDLNAEVRDSMAARQSYVLSSGRIDQ
jgi:hypothetical protein